MKSISLLIVTLLVWEISTQGVMYYDEKSPELRKCKSGGSTLFTAEQKKQFNCTNTAVKGNMLYCVDSPCAITMGNSCSWQVLPGVEIKPNVGYGLYLCKYCPSIDCGGKYAIPRNNECGIGGHFKTRSSGSQWYCENPNCKGKMVEQNDNPDDFWMCSDPTCWGTGSLNKFYKCEDTTCVNKGGSMKWDTTDSKWKCESSKCSRGDLKFVQKEDGWSCQSASCPGQVVEINGSFDCVDLNCGGKIVQSPDGFVCQTNTTMWFILGGGLVVVAIVGFILWNKKKNDDLYKLKSSLARMQVYQNAY